MLTTDGIRSNSIRGLLQELIEKAIYADWKISGLWMEVMILRKLIKLNIGIGKIRFPLLIHIREGYLLKKNL